MCFTIIPEPLRITQQALIAQRHAYANSLAPQRDPLKTYKILIFLPNQTLTILTSNPQHNLDNLFYELLLGGDSISKNAKAILTYRRRTNLTLDEIKQLEIKVIEQDSNSIEVQLKNRIKILPDLKGVYLLIFPNQKRYIGVSKNIKLKISQHLRSIFKLSKPQYSWHNKAIEDNCNWKISDIIIDFYSSDIKQQDLIKEIPIEDRDLYYNYIREN